MIKALSYQERIRYLASPCAKKLFELIEEKKTNMALSADVTTAEALLGLADSLGSEIAILKTHIDIIDDFTKTLIDELKRIANKHQFFIFEDRKFADIGNTVKQQYQGGIYRIADWADIINAHSLPGDGIILGLSEIMMKKNGGIVLIADMSSSGHLMNVEYRNKTLEMAEKFPEMVMGFITQNALSPKPNWINITPGIKLDAGKDQLGQCYITPEEAILNRGSDIIIVGRGILNAQDQFGAARTYREAGWDFYQQRIG